MANQRTKEQIAQQIKVDETIRQMKEKFPEQINEINIGFDCSTNFTGYAITLDGKLFDFGRIKTEPKEKYGNYAERLLKGSDEAINQIEMVMHRFFKTLTTVATKVHTHNKASEYIKKINIVFEATLMPQGNKFGRGFTITTTSKLMLYIGAISRSIADIIKSSGYPFANNIEYKFSKASEWQNRLYVGQGTREATKAESIKQAKAFMKHSGLEIIEISDDEADAINITRVANVMRDNLFVGRQNSAGNKNLNKTIPREIAKAKQFMANMESKAIEKRLKMVEETLYYRSDEFVPETPSDKAKKTKALKADIQVLKEQQPIDFMSPTVKARYMGYRQRIKQLEAQRANILEQRKLAGKVK